MLEGRHGAGIRVEVGICSKACQSPAEEALQGLGCTIFALLSYLAKTLQRINQNSAHLAAAA